MLYIGGGAHPKAAVLHRKDLHSPGFRCAQNGDCYVAHSKKMQNEAKCVAGFEALKGWLSRIPRGVSRPEGPGRIGRRAGREDFPPLRRIALSFRRNGISAKVGINCKRCQEDWNHHGLLRVLPKSMGDRYAWLTADRGMFFNGGGIRDGL